MPYGNADMPIYWYLFANNPSALNALHKYQKAHYGTNLEKPPQPKQKALEIPVIEDSEELERIMKQVPHHPHRMV